MADVFYTKVYCIQVQVDGKWKEFDGLEYGESIKADKEQMEHILKSCKENGIKARKKFLHEVKFQRLFA